MEKELEKLTKDDFLKIINKAEKINIVNQYYATKRTLRDRVSRVLDLRDILKITQSNNKKIKKVMNKCGNTSVKESSVNKLIKKMNKQEELIGRDYISAVISLMELVYEVMYGGLFKKDLPMLEDWYEFEMEDMVLVNDMIRTLDDLNSTTVTDEDILKGINVAIERYVNCIDNDLKYVDTFDITFPFVRIIREYEDDE